ncbi:MAG: HD domain-containing protein [Nitrosopumilus sp.]|nr:HD domain-containing protein [Nitrosopumilus sp.]
MDNTQVIINAKKFAYEKHKDQKRKDNVTPFVDHLEEVVNRLKNLGISNRDILSAAWLHDTIEYTDTTFDDINNIFGNTISVIVLSLTKDMKLTKKQRESAYIEQLKNSTIQAKLIKFCDISSNLRDIVVSPLSKNQKNKQVKKLFHYLTIIKKEISDNKSNYPKINEQISGINAVGLKFRQRPVII